MGSFIKDDAREKIYSEQNMHGSLSIEDVQGKLDG